MTSLLEAVFLPGDTGPYARTPNTVELIHTLGALFQEKPHAEYMQLLAHYMSNYPERAVNSEVKEWVLRRSQNSLDGKRPHARCTTQASN